MTNAEKVLFDFVCPNNGTLAVLVANRLNSYGENACHVCPIEKFCYKVDPTSMYDCATIIMKYLHSKGDSEND